MLQIGHPGAPPNFQRPNFGSQLEGCLASKLAKFVALGTLEMVDNYLVYQEWVLMARGGLVII